MKTLVFKSSIIPMIYIAIMTILWGDHSYGFGVFFSLVILSYHYLIDRDKTYIQNFLEINGLITSLFLVTLFLDSVNIILVLQYISLIVITFSIVYILAQKRKSIQ